MKLKLALPVLGALALMAALPDTAEAARRSSVDVSVGFGYSRGGGYHGRSYRSYDSGVSFRYSRGYSRGYDRSYSRGHYGRSHRHYNYDRGYHHYDRGHYNDRPHYYHSPRAVYRSYYTPRYYRSYDNYGYGSHGRPLYRRYYYQNYDYCY